MDTLFRLVNLQQQHYQQQSDQSNSSRTSSSSKSSTQQNQPHHAQLLLETAKAFADKNSGRVKELVWMLNELGSPYGDTDQKIAFYFLQALFSRMTDSVSPWTTFGHVACNGAIMDAFEGETKLHIIDISNTYCTQWPTLLEALATRTDETEHLRLTTVVAGGGEAVVQKVMREIGQRMEKFARLMGVPFTFNVIHHTSDLSNLNLSELDVKDDETLAVNCVGALHAARRRDSVVSMFRSLRPRIVTVVEEEADLNFGSDGFARTCNERLMLERAAGRAVVDLVACPSDDSAERREPAARWSRRMHGGGFSPVAFSDEVSDDVRALLRRYREGWSMAQCSDSAGIFLSWKDQAVVWASAWRP
ncbi:GRAS family transcription factor [Actinidia rufa]|uniref:GRAS family transcription factor n=1 Tax=Actinidia rufa TaxID=165716 RepID=A0A7J0F4V9_9ERIC|nr:GRAS family transcription factor [Actinidia rufa]